VTTITGFHHLLSAICYFSQIHTQEPICDSHHGEIIPVVHIVWYFIFIAALRISIGNFLRLIICASPSALTICLQAIITGYSILEVFLDLPDESAVDWLWYFQSSSYKTKFSAQFWGMGFMAHERSEQFIKCITSIPHLLAYGGHHACWCLCPNISSGGFLFLKRSITWHQCIALMII